MWGYKELIERLTQQGFEESVAHLRQAKSAFDRAEWESANAQVRTALESLFNAVAHFSLGTEKRGGEARKLLETKGILRAREASLLKSVMDVAGGAGSHAGRSGADESAGRFMAGLGMAYIGLGLVPDLVRVEQVLSVLDVPGERKIQDGDVESTCPSCRTAQRLSAETMHRDGHDTCYRCINGCQDIVRIGAPEGEAWEGRGYRLGDYVLRNAGDTLIHFPGGRSMLLAAQGAALMKRRPPAE
ncbi:hypothetical protein [Stenotrophomonas bentonitica]